MMSLRGENMKLFKLLASVLFAAVSTFGYAADPYPTKPVTLMVPYPAGGLSDTIARIVSGPLAKNLGQTAIVENLGGASGSIGAQKVLTATGDGYTVFQGSPNEVILAPLAMSSIKFKAEDFRLVQMIGVANLVLIARSELPVNSMEDVIALAKKAPKDKPLTYGSVGIGSFYHVLGEHFSHTISTGMTHVPYKGIAPLIQDISGNNGVDIAFLPYSKTFAGLAEQGKLKILGTLAAERPESLKQLPTVNEGKSLKDFNFSIWTGYMVKKDTPEEVVQQLHKALTATLADPEVRSKFEAQSLVVAQPMSLADNAKAFEAETARFRGIAKSIKLEAQ
jgi:tripartite-type tricarboxylate transporter receptor subunit TctC